MKKLLALVCVITTLPSFGQHEFGLKAGAGISYFTTRFSDPLNFEQKFSIQPTIQGGVYYNYHLSDRIHLGMQLIWMTVEGKEKMIVTNTDVNGIPNGNYTTVNLYREISYIGLPLYAGYTVNKWNFSLGALIHYPLHSSASEHTSGIDQNGQAFEWNHDGGELNIDQFNFGVLPGVTYELTELFSLEAGYYGTINNILNSPQLSESWKWHIHLLTVGLRFRILDSKASKDQ